MTKDIKIKSLYKALQVLDCFSVDEPELGVTEISKELSLYKSNVFNIVDTFVKAGYLEQNQENGKYKLSYKILELSQIISSNISFRKLILPYMQELANDTDEMVYLGVLKEGEVLYLDSASPKHKVSTRTMLGVKASLHCTGIGKAMLAFMSEDTVDLILEKGLTKFTENTIVDKNELINELELIRLRGYSIDNMEHEFGIKCVGMPIRDIKGEVVAGLSISGPSLRFDDDHINRFAQILKQSISEIERKL